MTKTFATDTAPPSNDTLELPAFSALVAAWNEAEIIDAHVRSFIDLDLPQSELILCAGGDDDTFRRAKVYESETVRVLEQQPGQGKQAALRAMYPHARHDIVYLTDADCLFDRESLRKVLAPLASGTHQAASGGSKPLVSQRQHSLVQYQWLRDRDYAARLGEVADGVFGRNCVVTRASLDAVGAFDEDVRTGTDTALSKKLARADIRVAAVPDSQVEADYPVDAKAYLNMWRRWIKNLVIHEPELHIMHLAKTFGLAFVLLVAPVSPLLLGWWSAPLVALFGVALLRRYRWLVRGHADVSSKTYLLAPLYLLLDQVAVLRAGLDLLSRRGRRRW